MPRLQIRDVLARLDGVGDVRIFGARDYSMRIWLDPEKIAARNLTASEVVTALQAQNVQVAAGASISRRCRRPAPSSSISRHWGDLATRANSATSW
jgi:multidrug efflux pump subunit AcrB